MREHTEPAASALVLPPAAGSSVLYKGNLESILFHRDRAIASVHVFGSCYPALFMVGFGSSCVIGEGGVFVLSSRGTLDFEELEIRFLPFVTLKLAEPGC